MRVLISGAGIGGLTAALCLHQAGHEVIVAEQAHTLSEVGAGLQLGANALCVFDHLGLLDQLQRVAVAPERILFRDYISGEALHSMELGDHYADTYGAPYYHVYRADLQTLLANELTRLAPTALKLGTSVISYVESEHDVEVDLSNRLTLQCDVLIGADGIRSTVRDQLLGRQEPLFTGNVAWRGVVDTQKLPSNWMDKIASNFVGPNKHVVLYYLRQQRLANFVGIVENPTWTNDSWVQASPWEELKQDFQGWHPTVQAIIDAVDKDQCYRWALYNHEPLSNWSSQRVSLLGDAAHATLPFMASGAAMAVEDARVLQRALDQQSSVEQGLQCYQRNRMQRTRQIQTSSADLGKIYHIQSRFLQKAAFKAIKLFGGRKERFLPQYNANTVELR